MDRVRENLESGERRLRDVREDTRVLRAYASVRGRSDPLVPVGAALLALQLGSARSDFNCALIWASTDTDKARAHYGLGVTALISGDTAAAAGAAEELGTLGSVGADYLRLLAAEPGAEPELRALFASIAARAGQPPAVAAAPATRRPGIAARLGWHGRSGSRSVS